MRASLLLARSRRTVSEDLERLVRRGHRQALLAHFVAKEFCGFWIALEHVRLVFHAVGNDQWRPPLRGHDVEFGASIEEEHHQSKLDAPSGTALLLQRQLRAEDHGRNIPISSIRQGNAFGTHTLTYQSAHETVTLRHAAQSREVFATGALSAAEWLPGHVGVFTFEQMLFGPA